MGSELELLRKLEVIVREKGGRFFRRTPTVRAPWVHFVDVLDQLEVLREGPKSGEHVMMDRGGPKRLWCVCGHHRHDHRRYDARLHRDGSCLEDDCHCVEFKSSEALSCKAVG